MGTSVNLNLSATCQKVTLGNMLSKNSTIKKNKNGKQVTFVKKDKNNNTIGKYIDVNCDGKTDYYHFR